MKPEQFPYKEVGLLGPVMSRVELVRGSILIKPNTVLQRICRVASFLLDDHSAALVYVGERSRLRVSGEQTSSSP